MLRDIILVIFCILAGGFITLWLMLCTPFGEWIGWVADEPPCEKNDVQ